MALPAGGRNWRELLQLARIGYVRGMEAKLAELECEAPALAPFCLHLRGWVRGFELAETDRVSGSLAGAESLSTRDIILVVDDTPETLGLLTDALESAGLTVLVATSGQAALATLKHITPDLILLDAVMPEMDGFATCRAMKADAGARAYSGDFHDRAFRHGACGAGACRPAGWIM